MGKCQVSGCENHPERKQAGKRIYFYTLLIIKKRNPNGFQAFLNAADIKTPLDEILESHRICSEHFNDNDYMPGELDRVARSNVQVQNPPRAPTLKPDVIPTNIPTFPSQNMDQPSTNSGSSTSTKIQRAARGRPRKKNGNALKIGPASGAEMTEQTTSDDESAAKRIKLSSPVTVKEESDCDSADPAFEFVHLLGVPEQIHTIKVEEPDEDIDIKYEPIGIEEEEEEAEPMVIEHEQPRAEPDSSNVQTQPFEEVLLMSNMENNSTDNDPLLTPNVNSKPIPPRIQQIVVLSSDLQTDSTENDPFATPNENYKPIPPRVKEILTLSSGPQTNSTENGPPSSQNVTYKPIPPRIKQILTLSSGPQTDSTENGSPSPQSVTYKPIPPRVKEIMIHSSGLQTNSTENGSPSPQSVTYKPIPPRVKEILIHSSGPQTNSTENGSPSPQSVTYKPIPPRVKEILIHSSSPQTNYTENGSPSPQSVTYKPIPRRVKEILIHSSSPRSNSTENGSPSPQSVTYKSIPPRIKEILIHSSSPRSNSTENGPSPPTNLNSISVPFTPSLEEVLKLSSNLQVNPITNDCSTPNVPPIPPSVVDDSEDIQQMKNNLVKFEKYYRNHIIEHTTECTTQFKTYNYSYCCPFCFYVFPCDSNSTLFLQHMGFESIRNKVSSRLLDMHKIPIHCNCAPCIFCTTIFDSIQSYQQHIEDVKHDFGQHLCSICDLKFISLCALNRHHKEMHEPIHTYLCRLCNMYFPNDTTFEMHKIMCRRDMHYCMTCDNYFMTPMESDDHVNENKSHIVIKVDPSGIIQTLPSSVKMKPCESSVNKESSTNVQESTNCHITTPLNITDSDINIICEKEIAIIENASNENVSAPKNSDDLFSKFESLNSVKNELMIPSYYVCPYCCMVFATKFGLLFHVGVVIGNINSETYTKAHLLRLNASRLKCVHCCEVILATCNIHAYNAHLSLVHSLPPIKYQCGEHCKASFSYICQLNKHKMSSDKFCLFMSCNNCKATFQNILAFWSHETMCKKFNTFCNLCKETFDTKFRYKNHQCNKQGNNVTCCVLIPVQDETNEQSISDFLKCTQCESASVCPALKKLDSKFVAKN